MKNLKITLAALAVLVSLSACSKTTAPSADNSAVPAPSKEVAAPVAPVANASTPDACKYLTKEIAESVVGPISKEPNTEGSNVGMSNCMYLSDDFSAVSLLITSDFSSATFDQAFQASKGISGVDPVKVEGLGDAAYWAGGTLNQMNILKGDNLMIIMAIGAKGDVQTVARGVAEKVLAKM